MRASAPTVWIVSFLLRPSQSRRLRGTCRASFPHRGSQVCKSLPRAEKVGHKKRTANPYSVYGFAVLFFCVSPPGGRRRPPLQRRSFSLRRRGRCPHRPVVACVRVDLGGGKLPQRCKRSWPGPRPPLRCGSPALALTPARRRRCRAGNRCPSYSYLPFWEYLAAQSN